MVIGNHILIVDDVLPIAYLNDIEQTLISGSTAWNFENDTVYQHPDVVDIWNKQMVHTIYYNGHVFSSKWDRLLPIVHIIEEKIQCQIREISRIKVNMTFTVPEDTIVYGWHSDKVMSDRTARSVILYINDSDGNTLITDTKAISADPTVAAKELSEKKDDFNISEVEYKRNRLVSFDSAVYHCGMMPKNHACRIVMSLIFYT